MIFVLEIHSCMAVEHLSNTDNNRHFDRSKRKDFTGKIDSFVQVLSNIKPYFKISFGNTLSNSRIIFV